MHTFPIILGGSPAEHARRLLEFEALVLDPPDSLLIKLLGSGGTHPTTALAYLDILALLPGHIHRAVISYSCLFGAGDFALWLEASGYRDIRRRASAYVARAAPVTGFEQFSSGHVLVAASISFPGENDVLCRDWDVCLRLMSRHVDLSSILDRVLGAEQLRELLLIDSYSVDALIAPTAGVPPLPNRGNASLAAELQARPTEEKDGAD